MNMNSRQNSEKVKQFIPKKEESFEDDFEIIDKNNFTEEIVTNCVEPREEILKKQCDDGNNYNGDGCSSGCSVETYYDPGN